MPVSINAVELTNPNIACKGGLALLHKIQKRQKKLTYIIVIQQGIPLLGKIFIRVDGHENIRLCNGGTLLKPPFRFQSKMETSNKKKRKDTSDQDFFAKFYQAIMRGPISFRKVFCLPYGRYSEGFKGTLPWFEHCVPEPPPGCVAAEVKPRYLYRKVVSVVVIFAPQIYWLSVEVDCLTILEVKMCNNNSVNQGLKISPIWN